MERPGRPYRGSGLISFTSVIDRARVIGILVTLLARIGIDVSLSGIIIKFIPVRSGLVVRLHIGAVASEITSMGFLSVCGDSGREQGKDKHGFFQGNSFGSVTQR